MIVYAIVDENLKIARHNSKKSLGVFIDLKMLKKHAWRYQSRSKKYKIAELEIKRVYDFD